MIADVAVRGRIEVRDPLKHVGQFGECSSQVWSAVEAEYQVPTKCREHSQWLIDELTNGPAT